MIRPKPFQIIPLDGEFYQAVPHKSTYEMDCACCAFHTITSLCNRFVCCDPKNQVRYVKLGIPQMAEIRQKHLLMKAVRGTLCYDFERKGTRDPFDDIQQVTIGEEGIE